MVAIQKTLPKPDFPGLSGTDCLTLNISIPSGNHSGPLPVLVFIHGGGFAVGSNWWPQYDMASIVRLSAQLGQPMICININYRLGAPGFTASEELEQAGYKTNRGLRDQRASIHWIKKYISGFGGDPDRITVAGESVGGLSAVRLLYTEEALISRVIVMGGAPPSVGPISKSVAESSYEALIGALGCKGLSATERIKVLQAITIEELQKAQNPTLPFIPVLDGELVPYNESFSFMQSKDYVFKSKSSEAVMAIHSPLDASIFAFMGLFSQRKGIASGFSVLARKLLFTHHGGADRLLRCYGITPELDDQDALLRVLTFGSDIGTKPRREHSPLAFRGMHSTHILDISFLLQNYNDKLDNTQRAAAEEFAKAVIAFVHGEKPWEPFSVSGAVAKLGGGQLKHLKGTEAMTEQYREMASIGQAIGFDTLLGLWLAFVFGS
ncbi:hypothetical protein NW755_003599 [Fusarium falciforme]|uniref:Carboxylesterase type B domain-containing protein n=1 Tax=Fusarium falciforme TaxID=195108 RepID=A0A9W8V4B5_9HYPO|nr:hypothetical protein NW755_003599 [Fusarium falciforme]